MHAQLVTAVPFAHAPVSGLPVFQVLDAADAFEGSVDHDGQASAQRFTLLHAADGYRE